MVSRAASPLARGRSNRPRPPPRRAVSNSRRDAVEVIGARRDPAFGDNGDGPAFQRFLHRPEGLARASRLHEHQPSGVEIPRLQPLAIGQADLARGHVLGDPDDAGAGAGGRGAQGEGADETGGGGGGARMGGNDFA